MDDGIFQQELSFHVGYDADARCVVAIWRGVRESGLFRLQNEHVLAELAQRGASKLLCDSRYFLGPLDGEWLATDWLPRAVQAGLRVCAMVAPVYYAHHMAVRTVANTLDPQRLRLEYFTAPEEARRWLRAA
jgi:hypothetical protein